MGDIIIQDFGSRGNISTSEESSFDWYLEIVQYFLENVNLAKEYLEEVLEIEDDEKKNEINKIANQIREMDAIDLNEEIDIGELVNSNYAVVH
ncbi:MAG: hypothetical protein ABGW47_00250 [Nitrosopumilus sp.]|jgi:hypothetical protein